MRTMLQLDDATRPVPHEILDNAGGFAWWYLEVEDDAGNGMVMIWSWGLPFLPGYVSAARRGQPAPPRSHPSLNVVVYRGGQETFYTLREFAPENADKGVGRWRFGDSSIETHVHNGSYELVAELCCPVAGSNVPMRASVRLNGRQPTTDELPPAGGGGHLWTPLACPAFATARVAHGDERFSIAGRAYHDRNYCDAGLQDLGIETWLWGRTVRPEGDRVFYVLWPEGGGDMEVHGWELDGDGQMVRREGLHTELPSAGKTKYGMPNWSGMKLMADGDPWVNVKLHKRIEDGPFYLRWQTEDVDSEGVHGTAEAIVPSRIDRGLHRPLVRMRVASEQRNNSIWLPLFDGPRGDRIKRLLLGESQ